MKRKGKKRVGKPLKPDLLPIKDLSFPRPTRTEITSGKIYLKEKNAFELQCPICNDPLAIIKGYGGEFGKLICRKCGYQKINKTLL